MFLRFSNNWQPYFAAPDTSGDSGGNDPLSKDDIIDYLNDDSDDDDKEKDDDETDDEKDSKKDKKETPKSKSKGEKKPSKDIEDDDESEESDEDADSDDELDLDELEEDLKDVDKEKLELVTPVRRSQILKKYPNVFKDFPYLEKAYFREQQYTEIFPHPDDAKQALDKAQTLERFENDLFTGNTETLLKAIKTETPQAFNKLVDNYLPTLAKIDPAAHIHVVGNTIKQTIMAMVKEGRNSNNESLNQAAQILNQFVFGSSEFEPPSNLTKQNPDAEKPDEEKVQLRKERDDRIRQSFNDAREGLNTRVNNSIKATIESNIDPKGSMTDYVKRSAVREAVETLDKLIMSDKRFITIVDRLWERSFKENFSRNSVDQIRSAYLSKAKTLLDSVIKKSRNDALRGIGKRVKEDKDTTEKSSKKDQRSDNERPRSSKSSGKSSDIPKGMSSLEFLMQED